jgi:hypothetical protein
MNFITISQFFNKLQSALLFILIVPLLVFIALYFHVSGILSPAARTEYFIIFPALVFLDWFMAMIIFNKKIKSVRKEQGLGVKLEKYFQLTIVRFSILSSGSLILALGLYLTKNDVFIWIYIGGLVLSGVLWPTSSKTSNDLRLKGDEREMVYFKKDTF